MADNMKIFLMVREIIKCAQVGWNRLAVEAALNVLNRIYAQISLYSYYISRLIEPVFSNAPVD